MTQSNVTYQYPQRDLSADQVYVGGIYRHYKGDEYIVLEVGDTYDEETGEMVVKYARVDGSDQRKWSRKVSKFLSLTMVTDQASKSIRVVPRFTFIGFGIDNNMIASSVIQGLQSFPRECAENSTEAPITEYTLNVKFTENCTLSITGVKLQRLVEIPRSQEGAELDLGLCGFYEVNIEHTVSTTGGNGVDPIVAVVTGVITLRCFRRPNMPFDPAPIEVLPKDLEAEAEASADPVQQQQDAEADHAEQAANGLDEQP